MNKSPKNGLHNGQKPRPNDYLPTQNRPPNPTPHLSEAKMWIDRPKYTASISPLHIQVASDIPRPLTHPLPPPIILAEGTHA